MRASLVALLGLAAVAGCSSSATAGGGGGGGPVKSGGDITVGVLGELTGDGAVISVPYVNGVKMAANEINKAGGVSGHKIVLKVQDSQTDPNAAVQAAAQLINVDKVPIIDCTCFSAEFFPVVKYAAQHHVLVVDGYGASSPEVRSLPADYVTLAELDDSASQQLADYVYSVGDHKAALLTDTDQFGVAFRKLAKAAFVKAGGTIGADIVGTPNLSDYRSQLQQLTSQQSKFDVVLSAVAFTEGKLQFKQYYQLGGRKPWAVLYPTSSGLDSLKEADGLVFGLQLALDSGHAATWSASYQKLYGSKDFTSASFPAAVGYDSLQWTSRALVARKDSSVDATRAAFKTAATQYSTGPTGPLQFDSQYARTGMHFAKYKLQGGKFVEGSE